MRARDSIDNPKTTPTLLDLVLPSCDPFFISGEKFHLFRHVSTRRPSPSAFARRDGFALFFLCCLKPRAFSAMFEAYSCSEVSGDHRKLFPWSGFVQA